MLSMLGKNDILKYFSNFSLKTGFDISYILSPKEKNKKQKSVCHLLNKPRES